MHPFLFSLVLKSHPFGLRLVDQLLLHTAKQNKKTVYKIN